MAYVKDPYYKTKIRTGEWAVGFRYLIGTKIQYKSVCQDCAEKDATKLVKLLNEDWSKNYVKARPV